VKLPEFGTSGRKSPRYSVDDALEKLKRIEKEENRRNQETSEFKEQEVKEQDQQQQEPKHIQRHYSYTYETPGSDESSVSTLGRLSVGGTPKRKFLESNFDENEQVITTVIETEIPMILPSTPGKYAKKAQAYSNDTPKWIRKYLENDQSPKVGRKTSTDKEPIVRTNSRRNSRRKSSLESIESVTKKPEEKARSKSASCEERSLKDMTEQKSNVRETYVRIVPSNNAQQENRYEVGVETTATSWTKTDSRGLYGDDTDTDDSTSI